MAVSAESARAVESFFASSELNNAPTILLGGAALGPGEDTGVQAALFSVFLASLIAFSRFLIQQGRFFGRSTPVAKRTDYHNIFTGIALNTQGFAWMNRPGGFNPLTTDVNPTAIHGFGRQGAGFEESRRP